MNQDLMDFILQIICKVGAYVINLHEYSGIGTHWIVLDALNNNIANFDSLEAEHIPKKNLKLLVIKT